LTEKGFLTPQERDNLRRKQCNSINRVAYVCCSTNGGAPPPPPVNLINSKFPKAPECGISLHDKVSHNLILNFKKIPIFMRNKFIRLLAVNQQQLTSIHGLHNCSIESRKIKSAVIVVEV
jgi:hypothetical protein